MTKSRMPVSGHVAVVCALAIIFLSQFAVVPALAQVLYGSIVGGIEDQTGSVVPKAHVTITNRATGVEREAEADEQGRYSILSVLPGAYTLRVTAPGFRIAARTDVEIAINSVTRENVRLEVG